MEEDKKELFEAILKLETIEECDIFFEDLCTFNEIESMTQRIKAAKMILEGKTFNEITATTKISSATLARVSKCVRHGRGGYKTIIEKTESEKKTK